MSLVDRHSPLGRTDVGTMNDLDQIERRLEVRFELALHRELARSQRSALGTILIAFYLNLGIVLALLLATGG